MENQLGLINIIFLFEQGIQLHCDGDGWSTPDPRAIHLRNRVNGISDQMLNLAIIDVEFHDVQAYVRWAFQKLIKDKVLPSAQHSIEILIHTINACDSL